MIDVTTQEVRSIEIEDGLQAIYDAIGRGCEIFECPVHFVNGDVMHVDEEYLLKPELQGGFVFYDRILLGNAIITGTDAAGNTTDVKTLIEYIRSHVRFMTASEAVEYRTNVIGMTFLPLN